MASKIKKSILSLVFVSLLMTIPVRSAVIESEHTSYLGNILEERFARSQFVTSQDLSRKERLMRMQEGAIQRLKSSVISDRTFAIGFQDSVEMISDDLTVRGGAFLSSLKSLMENAKSAYPEFDDIFSKLLMSLDEKSALDEKLEEVSDQGVLSKTQLEIETKNVQTSIDLYVQKISTLGGVIDLLGALPKAQEWINEVGSRTTTVTWWDSVSLINVKSLIRAQLLSGDQIYNFKTSDKLLTRDALNARLSYLFEILKKKFKSKADEDMSLTIRGKIQESIQGLKSFYHSKVMISDRLKAAKELKNWIATNDTLDNNYDNTSSLSIEARWNCYELISTVGFIDFDFSKDRRNIQMNREVLLSRVEELIESLENALKEVESEKNEENTQAIQEEDDVIEKKLKENIKSRSLWYAKTVTQVRIASFKELQKWINGKKCDTSILSYDAYWLYLDMKGFFGDPYYIGIYEGVSWSVLEKRVKKGLELEEEYLKNIGSKSGSSGGSSGSSSSSSSSYGMDYKTQWYSKDLKEQRSEIDYQISSMENSSYQKKNFRKNNSYAKFIYKLLLTDLKQDGITDENAFEKCKALDLAGIKKEYRKWSLKLHPDKTGGDEQKTEQFKYLTSAYDHLITLLTDEPF